MKMKKKYIIYRFNGIRWAYLFIMERAYKNIKHDLFGRKPVKITTTRIIFLFIFYFIKKFTSRHVDWFWV